MVYADFSILLLRSHEEIGNSETDAFKAIGRGLGTLDIHQTSAFGMQLYVHVIAL